MATTTADNIQIIGGVDTHQDLHTAAVVSHDGTVLGTESFSTTRAGYRAMLRWFRSHGELLRVGVESTGTYGAGITRHLALSGIPVLEVTGPDPASRRAKGKDDALDAISAAEAARTRRRVQVAKDRSGTVEALRVLRTTRKTAIKCRRAALQQLHNTIVAAPEEVRDQVRNLTRMQRLRTCAAWRPDTVGYRDPVVATKLSLKSLARRILDINDEIAELDRFIVPLVEELAPSLLELEGVGTENAGAVMVAVGDNPDRLRSEASFAMMCGVCPIPASSGKTQRHRLNRGGNRQANSALHMVVVCRMRTDERTRAYVARRTLEGLSKREIMRCLKRYVAREIYRVGDSPPHRVLDKHESVRGSQYCSIDYQAVLRKHDLLISMSGKGNCYDNAVVETFFKTIKSELIWPVAWQTRCQAENAVARYIDGFYNPIRRHSGPIQEKWRRPTPFALLLPRI